MGELRFMRTSLRTTAGVLAGSRPNVIISGFLAVTGMMIVVDVATVRETVVPVCEPLDV